MMLAAWFAVLCPFYVLAQFGISGKITESEKGNGLAGATVRIKQNGKVVIADKAGNYNLSNLSIGNYTLQVSFVGFETQEKNIRVETDDVFNFTLKPLVFLGEEVVVSTTRAGNKAAATFKDINKETIAKNNFGQDLPFILNNTPGVVVTSDAGAGVGYTGIRLRGSDATRVNVTINGIPYNDSESQGTFWVNMPDFASSVDNIQIQRGVGTSTNGAGAFGGSLNVQTTAGEPEAYAELNNTYGSYNTWKNTVKIGTGLIQNKWSFDGRLSRIKSNGFIDRASSNLKSYFLSGAYHGKNDLLRVNVFGGSEKTYQAWNGVPEAKLRNDKDALLTHYLNNKGQLYFTKEDSLNLFDANSRTYNQFLYKDQTDNYQQNHYQALYARSFSEHFSFNGALHYTTGKGYYEEYKNSQKFSKYGLENVVVNGTTVSKTDLVRRRWLDNNFYGLTYGFNYTPESNLQFTLAGGYNEYRGKHFGQVIWAKFASNGDNDRHYYENKANKDDFNTYLKVNYNPVASLNLFADLQYRYINYNILGTDKNVNQINLKDQLNFFNPKIGASYFINSNSNVYASFSVANKEPSRDDYINAEVSKLPKPERLNDLEAGYRLKTEALNLGANLYGMWYKDQLVVTGKVNDVGEYFRQNVDNSYRLGIEMDASYVFSKYFSVLANAAFSKNKIKNFVEFIDDYDNGGQIENKYTNVSISFSPNTVVGGELVFTPINAFALSWQSKYVGKQYLDNTQNEKRKLDGYLTNNIRLAYNWQLKGIKNINVAVLVNNVFNKKYESNGYTYSYYAGGLVTENFYFPQAGTNFLLNVNLKF